MAKRKTTVEQIEQISKRMEQMAAKRRQLQAKHKEEERKARAHRLIQIGAEVEHILGKPIEEKDLPKLVKFLSDQERRGKYFSKAMEDKQEENQSELSKYR